MKEEKEKEGRKSAKQISAAYVVHTQSPVHSQIITQGVEQPSDNACSQGNRSPVNICLQERTVNKCATYFHVVMSWSAAYAAAVNSCTFDK